MLKLFSVVKTETAKVKFKLPKKHDNIISLVGRCHTNLTMDTMIVQPTDHCHAPRIDIIPISVVKNKIKAQAVGTEEAPSDILSSALQSFPLEFAVRLPQKDTLLRTIRRQRQHK